MIDFKKINLIITRSLVFSKGDNALLKISILLSSFYILIQFIDSVFFYQKNLGDEWFFTRDLKFFISDGYYKSVVKGISVPFTTLASLIYVFLEDISKSLRFANSIIVLVLFLYLYYRKDLLRDNNSYVFTAHSFFLIGTTGGMFYGTNDSFLFVSVFILFAETYLYLRGYKVNTLFLVFVFSICILSRPHWIIYLLVLFFSLHTFLLVRDGFNIKSFYNPILLSFFISFLFVLLFNYPKLIEKKFSHDQGNYLPKYLFLSYSDKSGTYKTDDPDFNWIEWCFYSQMIAEDKRFGLFARFVNWEEVREYKLKNASVSLPSSYQEYILKYPSDVLKRIPFSIIEIFVYSLRYVGIFLILMPFWLIYKNNKKNIGPHLFISILTLTGIISWAIISPTTVSQQRFMPFYLMLIILVTDRNYFNFNSKIIINLNLIIINFSIVYALIKWGVFRSL